MAPNTPGPDHPGPNHIDLNAGSDPGPLSLVILISADKWRRFKGVQPLVEKAATVAHRTACERLGKSGPHEITVNLSNDATITELNHTYRHKNTATNVLSFPFEDDFPDLLEGPLPLGDLVLAHETVEREAREQALEFGHHLAHLVVHGVLHLFGYDHMEDGEAQIMEALEVDILAELLIPSPYRQR